MVVGNVTLRGMGKSEITLNFPLHYTMLDEPVMLPEDMQRFRQRIANCIVNDERLKRSDKVWIANKILDMVNEIQE